MTTLERIARDLAAELSSKGEDDWRRFIPLAREVGKRLDRQVDAVLGVGAEQAGPTGHDGPPQRADP